MNEHSLPLCSPVAAPKSFPICNEKDEEGSEEEEEEEEEEWVEQERS